MYPLIFAKDDIKDLIVAGSVNINGVQSPFSQGGPLLTISAPGEDIWGAGIHSPGDYYQIEGTSFATGSVSGLAAYFMSINPDLQGVSAPAKVKAYMQSAGWPRIENGVLAIWNQKQSHVRSGGQRRAAVQKRDDGVCSWKFTTSTTATATGKAAATASVTATDDPC